MAGEAVSRSKEKGSRFEQQVVDYMRAECMDDRIERRVCNGVNDRGDVSGVAIRGNRVVVECKNHARMELGAWLDEAEVERGNDDAEFAFVVHKRRGCGEKSFGRNYVTCDLYTLCALIAGNRSVTGSASEEVRERRAAAREELELRGIDHDG